VCASKHYEPIDVLQLAKDLLAQEACALTELQDQLDPQALCQALQIILDCQGMVMVVGAGTSSSIARRLAHVLSCSGKPSMFLDPGQAQHGYSGVVSGRDVIIAFSRGGETDEVNHVLRIARARGAKAIGIMEQVHSTMGALCDVALSARVAPENDAVDVIPLASTLVHAAVGDVLCAAVLSLRGFDDQEFAALHPGGAVGKRLSSDDSRKPSGSEV
jgi:arabinose-5-phosphate isomerase